MQKAPIKYFGGKGGMLNKLLPYFPPESEYQVFIEPFCGSAVVALNIQNKPIIINDLNLNVYSLYTVLSDEEKYQKLVNKLDKVFYHEKIREDMKKALKAKTIDDVQRAFAFFVVNRMSHNGVGGLSTTTLKRRDTSKSVADFEHSKEQLGKVHQKLKKMIVLNRNGIDIIRQYDRAGHFMYLDPPYHQSTRTNARYEIDMNDQQQIELIDTLLNVKKAKILLSGYNNELYEKLELNGWHRHDFNVKTVDGQRRPKQKIESLWCNYNYLKD